MKAQKRAFTIIELMVVLGVIAVLATMAIFGINLLNRSVEATQRKNVLTQLETFVQGYKNDNGTIPLTSQVVFNSTQKEVYVDSVSSGVKFVGNANEYCYTSTDGITYSMGVKVNGQNTFRGTASANCTIP